MADHAERIAEAVADMQTWARPKEGKVAALANLIRAALPAPAQPEPQPEGPITVTGHNGGQRTDVERMVRTPEFAAHLDEVAKVAVDHAPPPSVPDEGRERERAWHSANYRPRCGWEIWKNSGGGSEDASGRLIAVCVADDDAQARADAHCIARALNEEGGGGEAEACDACGHTNGKAMSEAERLYSLARATYDPATLLRRLVRGLALSEEDAAPAPPAAPPEPFRVIQGKDFACVVAWTGDEIEGWQLPKVAEGVAENLNRLFALYAAPPPSPASEPGGGEPGELRDAVKVMSSAVDQACPMIADRRARERLSAAELDLRAALDRRGEPKGGGRRKLSSEARKALRDLLEATRRAARILDDARTPIHSTEILNAIAEHGADEVDPVDVMAVAEWLERDANESIGDGLTKLGYEHRATASYLRAKFARAALDRHSAPPAEVSELPVNVLRPCPFCGGEYEGPEVRYCSSDDEDGETEQVECRHCGAAGPEAHGDTENGRYRAAQQRWNDRSPQPAPPALSEEVRELAAAAMEAGRWLVDNRNVEIGRFKDAQRVAARLGRATDATAAMRAGEATP